MKKIITVFIAVLFVSSLFAQQQEEIITYVKVGDQAPDFSITMEDGSVKKLSDLKGKVVWLNFFANWCPPCLKELPHLEKEVYKKYKGKNLEVMVIGREHDWATVNKFKKDKKYTLPFYPDVKREIFSKYANASIPRNFLIDKNGKVVVASEGYTDEEFKKLIKELEKLL